MTQIDEEKLLNKYTLPVTIDETELILKQMRNSICKIENEKGKGTGFFCEISNKKLLITNNHIINEEIIKDKNKIKVKLNDNTIKKDIEIKDYYTSIEYDTTIIEINDNDENINYLELDDDIFDENINIDNKSIYIIQYPKYGNEQKAAVSYGILNKIKDKYKIIHYCSTDHGSSGSPILGLSNQKIIGMHRGGIRNYNYNRGILLKYPINEYLNKKNEINEIKLKIKIEKEDINNDIYFLDNTYHHDYLKELNELNSEIFINNKKYKYTKSFKPEKEGLYEIIIKFNINIKNCSHMFRLCSKLTNIDLSSFDTKNVTNMSNMLGGCSKLTNVNLSSFDTKNVTDMSFMFYDCSKLTNINLSSFDTKNVTDMSSMFDGCFNLTNINLSSFDTKNVINMSSMFDGCFNLTNINLSSFDTKNVSDLRYLFYGCFKLNLVKINSMSSNKIKKLLEDTNAYIIDQFGNNISKNNYLNNNSNNFYMNNLNNNMMKTNNINMNNNMINNNFNMRNSNNININNNMTNNNFMINNNNFNLNNNMINNSFNINNNIMNNSSIY